MVIPRHPVRIRQHGARGARGDGAGGFIADPRSAVFYNAGQRYDAEQLVGEGEDSIFFALPASIVLDVVRESARSSRSKWLRNEPIDDPDRPIPFTHGPCDARSFELQQRLVRYLQCCDVDGLAVEETTVELSARLLRLAFAAAPEAEPLDPPTPADRRRCDSAEAARLVLLRHFREPLSLGEVAQQVGLSSHHLCRVFRAHVGQSMHQYRLDLRLRASLEPLCDAKVSLAALALDLGFNSQSHFTTAFCRRFGCTPARFRRDGHDPRAFVSSMRCAFAGRSRRIPEGVVGVLPAPPAGA